MPIGCACGSVIFGDGQLLTLIWYLNQGNPMIYVLTGLSEEANVITDRDNVTVLTGIQARGNLDSIVGNDCEAMISFGTAGALRSEVKVGEVVLPLFIA